MKATLYIDNCNIGDVIFSIIDESMGGIFGEFTPTEINFDKIQKYV